MAQQQQEQRTRIRATQSYYGEYIPSASYSFLSLALLVRLKYMLSLSRDFQSRLYVVRTV